MQKRLEGKTQGDKVLFPGMGSMSGHYKTSQLFLDLGKAMKKFPFITTCLLCDRSRYVMC